MKSQENLQKFDLYDSLQGDLNFDSKVVKPIGDCDVQSPGANDCGLALTLGNFGRVHSTGHIKLYAHNNLKVGDVATDHKFWTREQTVTCKRENQRSCEQVDGCTWTTSGETPQCIITPTENTCKVYSGDMTNSSCVNAGCSYKEAFCSGTSAHTDYVCGDQMTLQNCGALNFCKWNTSVCSLPAFL